MVRAPGQKSVPGSETSGKVQDQGGADSISALASERLGIPQLGSARMVSRYQIMMRPSRNTAPNNQGLVTMESSSYAFLKPTSGLELLCKL